MLLSPKQSEPGLLDAIVSEFSFLCSLGFAEPTQSVGHSMAALCWKHWKIAIEVEVDWRELDMFLLIVRLEGGSMPSGYYVSGGKPCRFHLQKVIVDRGWPVDESRFRALFPGKFKVRRRPSREDLDEKVMLYQNLLQACIGSIMDEQEVIFS